MRSIVARLMLIVAIALAPFIALELYAEAGARQLRQKLASEEARRLVQLVSTQAQGITEAAEQTLDALGVAILAEGDAAESCRRLLAGLPARAPRYAAASVVGLDGHPLCTTDAGGADPSAADWFRRAVQTGHFVIAGAAPGAAAAPAIHMAEPLRNRAGTVAGVIDLALRPDWLSRQLDRLALPPGASAWITDRTGTVLAHRPAGAPVDAPALAASDPIVAPGGDRIVATQTASGRPVLLALASPAAGPDGLLIAVALDRATSLAELRRASGSGPILLILGVCLALGLAALLGTYAVGRPFRRLLRVAHRWRAGDLAARAALRDDTSEFGRLGAALDAMAVAREAHARALRTALESTTDSVLVIDPAWRFTYLNAPAKTRIAADRDVLGVVVWQAFPETVDTAIGRACRAAARKGLPTRAEGPFVVPGRHFEAHAYPSDDGLTVFLRDVTEDRRVAAALRQSEACFQATFEHAAVGMAQAALDGTWLRVNDRLCAIVGYPRAELLGRTFRDITHPDDVPATLARSRMLVTGERTTYTMEKRYLRRDGGTVWVNVTVSLLRDAEGRPDRFIGVIEDISGRRQTEAALRRVSAELEARVREETIAREVAQARAAQAERMQALGQLAGGIAHDFNNVLQAVSGAVALIDRRPDEAAEVRRFARVALEAVERGASVTRRLLAFGRRGDLRAATVDAASVLSGLGEILAHTLGPAVTVGVRLDGAIPPVHADKGQLETVLVNLATNARDAMPEGGQVTFSAGTEIVAAGGPAHPEGLVPGRYVRLAVSDTGAGMDAATLARATEPFFTTKGVGVGTGLGLPMAKGFAEQSGGGLGIDSAPGCGTTVTLWLPEADPHAASSDAAGEDAPDTAAPPAPAALAAARVLLVEDEDVVREVIAEHLEHAGLCVLQAANGTAALDLLAAGETMDALVTDLSMPDVDGLAIIRAAQARHPGLPAVLLTGYAGDGAALAVGDTIRGMFSLMRKPVSGIQLLDRIRTLLAGHAGGR